MSQAFAPVRIGSWDLPQSFVMAPMTRSRAGVGNAPTALNAEYYAQRAGAGLIITEGTAPSPVGQGYPSVPGLYTPEQVDGWRAVTSRVHAEGAVIVAQLMHVGRIAHASNKNDLDTIAPSAVQAPGQIFTPAGMLDHDVPRAIGAGEISEVVAEFVAAAVNAIDAGLDGVEIHSANGYLLHQFLDPTVNRRNDLYGGTPQRRARFVIEVIEAVAAAIGAERVGVRLSPGHQFNGIGELPGNDLTTTYRAVVDAIAPIGLGYLSLIVSHPFDQFEPYVGDLRARFGGSVLINTATPEPTTLNTVERLLSSRLADSVAVGRGFLANPDLVERWRIGAELNNIDFATVYSGDSRGYTDYPVLVSRQ